VSLRVTPAQQRLPTVEIAQLNPPRIGAGVPASVRVTVRVELSGYRVQRAEVLRDTTRLGDLRSIRRENTAEIFEATLPVPALNPGTSSIVAVAHVVPAASEFETPRPIRSRPQLLRIEAASPPAAPSITIIDVQPRQILQNMPTEVVVTAALSQGRWTVRSGQLLEQGVRQPLAAFQTSGRGSVLTARFVAQRATPGSIPLVARVEVTPIAALAASVLRSESSVFALQVVPPPATQVQDKGLVLTVPTGFARIDTKGGAILFTNFPASSFSRGGIPPQGGCLIEATRTGRAAAATRNVMASETEVPAGDIQTLQVAGRNAFRTGYEEEFGPGRSLEYVAVYVESPNAVHKFFLSFLAGDAVADRCERSLDSVLATARITD
jgi:hypothetical protein